MADETRLRALLAVAVDDRECVCRVTREPPCYVCEARQLLASPSGSEPAQGDEWSELERLARAATPGPWRTEVGDPGAWGPSHFLRGPKTLRNPDGDEVEDPILAEVYWKRADARFIAAANPATVLRLISALRSRAGKEG